MFEALNRVLAAMLANPVAVMLFIVVGMVWLGWLCSHASPRSYSRRHKTASVYVIDATKKKTKGRFI